MRVLLLLGALLIATPAYAINDSIISYCLTTQDPQRCLSSFVADERAHQERLQRETQQRQIDAQLEQARIQANGMALFGAGNALINGMNQGFRQMQQPYVNTPYFSHPDR